MHGRIRFGFGAGPGCACGSRSGRAGARLESAIANPPHWLHKLNRYCELTPYKVDIKKTFFNKNDVGGVCPRTRPACAPSDRHRQRSRHAHPHSTHRAARISVSAAPRSPTLSLACTCACPAAEREKREHVSGRLSTRSQGPNQTLMTPRALYSNWLLYTTHVSHPTGTYQVSQAIVGSA